jgi:hypothetical protein
MNITAKDTSCQQQHIQLAALRYYFDQRTLEAHLTSLLEAAHLERARGTLAGSPIFAVLTHQAASQVTCHCIRWELDPQQIEAELPSLAELRKLAMPYASTCMGLHRSRWILIALATLAISVALTKGVVWSLPLFSQ